MKNTLKTILSLSCVIALIMALAVGASASGEPRPASGEPAPAAAAAEEALSLEEVYSVAQRALDTQAVENIMNRHVMYHCYGEHREEMEQIWVQEKENRETASFGQNQGFMLGFGSIWDGYVTGHDTSWLSSAKRYCQSKGIDVSDWTDDQILEVYGGVGQLLLHVTTTAIIEVAEDGKTAKGFWYSPGMIKETGGGASAMWEAYGADFVKEAGGWKLWHLHMYTDFGGGFFVELGNSSGSGEASGAAPASKPEITSAQTGQTDTAEIDEFLRHDYLSSPQYTQYSTNRLRSEMEVIPFPLPYETWDFSVPNYGPTAAEYAANGIDINAWYAAH